MKCHITSDELWPVVEEQVKKRSVPKNTDRLKRVKDSNGKTHLKQCRCVGGSTGKYVFGKYDVPVAVGIILGGTLVLTCDKCGKEWK